MSSVLLLGGVGGHLEQLIRIKYNLNVKKKLYIGSDQIASQISLDIMFKRVVDYNQNNYIFRLYYFISNMVIAYNFFRKNTVNAIISTGPAFVVPVAIVAKFYRIKLFHIESWSRVSSVSNTTKLLLRFKLVHKLYCQYPEHTLVIDNQAIYIGHL